MLYISSVIKVRKGMRRLKVDIPSTLYEAVELDASQRMRKLEDHVCDILRASVTKRQKFTQP